MIEEKSFAFVRNLQGDTVAVVDNYGTIIIEYSYDPWGNIEYHLAEGVTEDEAIIFTALCPLTYRGYNYDFTTGLYYLQSRYYNPEWGRFLNCDDTNILLATQGETHNANLFAYCNNNPVNKVDYNGFLTKSFKNPNELATYMIMLLYCGAILQANGFEFSEDFEPYDFDYSETKDSILVFRIAFKHLLTYECRKIMVGTISAWKKFENIKTLESDEIWDMLDDSSDNLSNYYNEYLGVHSEYREEAGTATATNILIATGYIVNYSMYFPILLIDQNSYKNSYTYQWHKFSSYDGMYAISKKYTYMSKKRLLIL